MPPARPRTASRCRLTLAGKGAVVVGECSGLGSETQVAEYRDGSNPDLIRKVAGASEWSEIVVRRGLDSNRTLWDWRDQAMKQGSAAARVDGKIEALDTTGASIATYEFKQGWPANYELHAPSGEPARETLTIVHDGLVRS